MMAAALALTAIGVGLVYIFPQGGSIWVAMFLLMVMALGIFMGKAVILAPIAELHLPEEINGSAMAVGSFLVYASIFWANPMTAAIVESHRETPHVGYQQIFLITLCVALVGAFCAILLDRINARVLLRTSEEAVDGETLEPVTE